jgi:uncharacterized membrane protein YdfJ with MMPL/SSD domain
MNLHIIIVGAIGIFFLFLLCRALSRNSKSRKYLNKGQFFLLVIVLGAIIAFCFLFVGKTIYRNGIGELFTDYDETSADTAMDKNNHDEGTGDTLIIVVNVDQVHIGDSSYTDITEVQQIIAEAVRSGKSLRIIDDYALADTYNQIIDVITQMNISRSSIEEIEQP